jgi:hypothetical protein
MLVRKAICPEAGSLERLLSELDFNYALAHNSHAGALFEVTQFRRAIADGTFTWIPDNLRLVIHSAYNAMLSANGSVDALHNRAQGELAVRTMVANTRAPIEAAIQALKDAL